MKIEKREFEKGKVRMLLFVCENEQDSKLFDWLVGDKVGEDGLIGNIKGKIKLSDGYGEEYLSIQKEEKINVKDFLLAEIQEIKNILLTIPKKDVIDRMSFESRLISVQNELAKLQRTCKYPDCDYYSKTAKNYCCDACYSDHKDSLIISVNKKLRNANENKKINRTSPKRRSHR